ncbi:MAG: acylphosphatase [Halobacteriota archaeon]|nr:acylphosphatase [Halobacteriota archaeon]
MKSRVHIVVSGKVQGVFFRHHTKEAADELSLYGWVRNLRNGDVELIAEGYKNDLEQFVEKVRKGSPFAIVRDIKVEWSDYLGEYDRYSVRFD